MKKIILLLIVLSLSFNIFSQTYKIYGNSQFSVDYYLNSDVNNTMTAYPDANNTYSISFDCNQVSKITLLVAGEEKMCTQIIDTKVLCSYMTQNKITQIRNDITHLPTFICGRSEMSMPGSYEYFTGTWKGKDVQVSIFPNKRFSMTYKEGNDVILRQGFGERINSGEIILTTVYIENSTTETFTDSNEVISFIDNQGSINSK